MNERVKVASWAIWFSGLFFMYAAWEWQKDLPGNQGWYIALSIYVVAACYLVSFRAITQWLQKKLGRFWGL